MHAQQRTQPTITNYFRRETDPHPTNQNENQDEPANKDSTKKKKTNRSRANVKIATLNIRGGGSEQTRTKWQDINKMMKKKEVGILAVQETHLTPDHTGRLNAQYEKRMMIFNLIDMSCPNSKGVAIIIHKDKVNCDYEEIKTHEISKGRALLLSLPWTSRKERLTILAVYAPNDLKESKSFWGEINDKLHSQTLRLPKPDVILGDFNLVEEALDRSPPHLDNRSRPALNALLKLKHSLKLLDGWRETNPGEGRRFTWETRQADQSAPPPENLPKSRIDRIYIKKSLYKKTSEWEIRYDHPIATDHELVTVRLIDTRSPYLGRGRYQIPSFLIDDEDFLDVAKGHVRKALEDIQRITIRIGENNPQTIFHKMKTDLTQAAKRIAREKAPKIQKAIEEKHDRIDEIMGNDDLTKKEKAEAFSRLNKEIKELELRQHNKAKMNTSTKFALEGKNIGKAWIRANKKTLPRDTIAGLKRPDGTTVTKSIDMANLARDYHESIQADGLPDEERRTENKAAIEKVLQALKKRTRSKDKERMSVKITEDKTKAALLSMPSGKSPGLDSIPTELWKELSRDQDKATKSGREEDLAESPDVVSLLTQVYNDIEKWGTKDEGYFAQGWMCPLYKKKARDEIANYRPITVLNADYKILTKALTIRLAPTALHLIHPDQAGFLKGRRIDDHTELIKQMIHWCEAKEEDGMLVFLDQEKAYNKITHDFLWRSLETMELP